DRPLERVAAKAFAVHLADEVGRHLARPEARHSDLRRETLHLHLDPRLDVLRGDGQHEGALQALVLGLDGLDGHCSLILIFIRYGFACAIFVLARPPDGLCAKMVRAKGLEPPHLSILEPKSSAST